MVTWDEMYEAMLVTRRNKRRSQDSVEFEIHWERKLMNLIEDINTRTVAPTAYTFVTEGNSREVFACEFAMRIIHHYIDIRLRPLLEDELTPFTYNNRVGFGPNEALKQVQENIRIVSHNYTRDAYIIQWDIEGYFPNAIQDLVYDQLIDLANRRYEGEDKEDLLYMIQISVYSYPTHHCFRKSPLHYWDDVADAKSLFKKEDGIGGAIGHLIWQNAMNYYLNDLDHWIVEEMGIAYVRFVDDAVAVVENKEAALAFLMPEIRRRMTERGCTLHRRKFYCQHYTKGVRFIGTYIKPAYRTYLNNRVITHAYGRLKFFNNLSNRAKEQTVESFLSSINSYIGLLKVRSEFNNIKQLVASISPAWFKYVHMNWDKVCLNANPGYTHVELLAKKTNYKIKPKSKHKGNGARKNSRRQKRKQKTST